MPGCCVTVPPLKPQPFQGQGAFGKAVLYRYKTRMQLKEIGAAGEGPRTASGCGADQCRGFAGFLEKKNKGGGKHQKSIDVCGKCGRMRYMCLVAS